MIKTIVRLVTLSVILLAVISGGFLAYGNILIDYSLESLESALSTTSFDSSDLFVAEKSVYKALVEDVALEEVVREDSGMQNALLLDFASRAVDEVEDQDGHHRAGIYIEEVIKDKKANRSQILKQLDKFYYAIKDFFNSLLSFLNYAQKKVSYDRTAESDGDDYSGVYLLVQADQKLAEGEYEESVALYRKFLEFYPDNSERGFVAISLANIFMRQGKYAQAQQLLEDIKSDFLGRQEGEIAARFLERLENLKGRYSLIDKLRQLIETSSIDSEKRELLELKLALAYMSTYQFQDSENVLNNLVTSSHKEVLKKAQFYLGWLYKMMARYEESTRILTALSENDDIEEELNLGLHAQLADVYYLQNDIENSLKHYQVVSAAARKKMIGLEAAESAWSSLVDLERANIYYFSMNDSVSGQGYLQNVGGYGQARLNLMQTDFSSTSSMTLRNRAFQALVSGRVRVAYNLLKKNLSLFPRDPWTHSGMATIYLLFADLDKAIEYAKKGYQWHKDEYTIAVLAYVYGYAGQQEEAIRLYQKAISLNPDYLPAYFNLACMHLELNGYQEALKVLESLMDKLEAVHGLLRMKALNNMGYAYWGLGEPEEAKKYFKEALAINKDFDLAQRNLVQLFEGATPAIASIRSREFAE